MLFLPQLQFKVGDLIYGMTLDRIKPNDILRVTRIYPSVAQKHENGNQVYLITVIKHNGYRDGFYDSAPITTEIKFY